MSTTQEQARDNLLAAVRDAQRLRGKNAATRDFLVRALMSAQAAR